MFRKVFFLIGMIFSAGAAEMVMDINFDGHPDKLIPVKSTENGRVFDVMIFKPEEGKYHRDPQFSTLIAGEVPLLDPEEKSIQIRLQAEGKILPVYKFYVRNGELCFANGEKVPALKFDWSMKEISPDMWEFDRKAGKTAFDEAYRQWEALLPELAARQIPYSPELFRSRFNGGHRTDPRQVEQWKEEMRELYYALPDELPSGEFTPEINGLRQKFLTENAAKIARMEVQTRQCRNLILFPESSTPLFDQLIFSSYSSLRDAARVYAVKIRFAAAKKDWAGVMDAFTAGNKLILPPDSLLHLMINSGIDGSLIQALCDALYQAEKQRELTPELIAFAREVFAGREKKLLQDFYTAYQMEAAYAFDVLDSMISGHGELGMIKRPEGVVLYSLATLLMLDKVTIGKFFCNALDMLKKDPYLAGEPDWQPGELYIAGVLVNMDILPQPLYNALAFYRSANAFLIYLENGNSLPVQQDPYSNGKLRFYRGEFSIGQEQKKVYGIRIYSVGSNRKDENGSGDDRGINVIDSSR